jgi:hypothetical protein
MLIEQARAERFSAACGPVHNDENIGSDSSGDVALGHDSGAGHDDFGGAHSGGSRGGGHSL